MEMNLVFAFFSPNGAVVESMPRDVFPITSHSV